jgi:acetylglutamate kinase
MLRQAGWAPAGGGGGGGIRRWGGQGYDRRQARAPAGFVEAVGHRATERSAAAAAGAHAGIERAWARIELACLVSICNQPPENTTSSFYNAHCERRLPVKSRKIFSGPPMNATRSTLKGDEQNNDLTAVSPQIKAQILAEALPYIRNFHGKTIVIKYGGNAMTDERLKHGFARDVILLKLVGMNPVVVHGGGPQIDNALKKIGKQGTFVQGMRITDEETMEVVEWVLGGEVQQDIVMLINHYGGQAVGLTGKDGGLIRARKMAMPDRDKPGEFLDIGFVGEIEAINPAVVKALQDDAFIPIISPIGFGQDGQAYNINADVVAGKIAEILKAEKLIMMTNIAGVQDKQGNLVTDLSAREIDEMFADGTISGGMLPKISSALDAAKSGVNTVHIIDGRIEHSLLLEVLTEQAFGTMIRSH